jgi:protein TonB
MKRMLYRGRVLAANKALATKLLVIMNSDGAITRVQVEDTSGVVDLDQAAVEAFNRAGPFPNPPQKIRTLSETPRTSLFV